VPLKFKANSDDAEKVVEETIVKSKKTIELRN
jgi:hypothetical protein